MMRAGPRKYLRPMSLARPKMLPRYTVKVTYPFQKSENHGLSSGPIQYLHKCGSLCKTSTSGDHHLRKSINPQQFPNSPIRSATSTTDHDVSPHRNHPLFCPSRPPPHLPSYPFRPFPRPPSALLPRTNPSPAPNITRLSPPPQLVPHRHRSLPFHTLHLFSTCKPQRPPCDQTPIRGLTTRSAIL